MNIRNVRKTVIDSKSRQLVMNENQFIHLLIKDINHTSIGRNSLLDSGPRSTYLASARVINSPACSAGSRIWCRSKMVNYLATLMLVCACCPYIEYTVQHAATVAFMGITGVNIYAATIIVYIIAGIANADKRSSNLYDESWIGKPRLGTRWNNAGP